MPINSAVQRHDGTSCAQPSTSSRTSATGTRLRRRLSAIFHWDRADSGLGCRCGCPPFAQAQSAPWQQPRGNLPIAAHPAVRRLTSARSGGKILVQLDVAEQAGAGVAAFEQVVAEDRGCRAAAAQRLLEGVDVVDALADERALAEQVLVHVD
jgi:hypothetical protein